MSWGILALCTVRSLAQQVYDGYTSDVQVIKPRALETKPDHPHARRLGRLPRTQRLRRLADPDRSRHQRRRRDLFLRRHRPRRLITPSRREKGCPDRSARATDPPADSSAATTARSTRPTATSSPSSCNSGFRMSRTGWSGFASSRVGHMASWTRENPLAKE